MLEYSSFRTLKFSRYAEMCWIEPRCLSVQVVFGQDEPNRLITDIKAQPVPDEPCRSFRTLELKRNDRRLFLSGNLSVIASSLILKSIWTSFEKPPTVILNGPSGHTKLASGLVTPEFPSNYVFYDLSFQSLLFQDHDNSVLLNGQTGSFEIAMSMPWRHPFFAVLTP